MTENTDVVFMLDVDNTLFDHDALKLRVTDWISNRPERVEADLFWTFYEKVRSSTGIVNFMEAARQFGVAAGSQPLAFDMRCFLWDFPFSELMFPDVLNTVRRLRQLGPVVILCDGHEPFQRRKVSALGLTPHLDGQFVFDHKELHIGEVTTRFPASHYVLIDDKPRIHDAVKKELGSRVTTIQIEHGHYARSRGPEWIPADFSVRGFRRVLELPMPLFAAR